MEYKDYYKTLGVSKTASTDDIRTIFRKLARKYHPDVNPGNKEAEQKFKEINEAHSVLSDPEKRKKYDELGSNWERVARDQEYAKQYASQGHYQGEGGQTQSFDFGDMSDFFATFFGGGGLGGDGSEFGQNVSFGGRGRRATRGADYEHEIEITLEDAFFGTKRSIRLQAQEICPRCQGNGMLATSSGRQSRQVINSATPCPNCGGSGSVNQIKTLDVKIPKGMSNGSKIRLAGQGGTGTSRGPNGDLYLRVKLQSHRFFQIEDHNLLCELPVLDYEAALGAQVELPTLTGKVTLKIPPETQSGNILRLKEQGLPYNGESRHGDLMVKIKIVVPTKISNDEKRLFEELKRIRTNKGLTDDPRRNLF
jgi:molecular chaperone DnaJ